MALPNPWYIDAEARHFAQQQRLLAYAAVEGKEGVLGETQLRVLDLDTPGGAIQVMPGGYSILGKHLGGEFEAYVGKFTTAEQVTVNPTDSSGSRTDLVILRVENPYVTGAGTWAQPADPLNGPYVHVRVIEGVAAGTSSVQQVNTSWSAIALARIHRPANTGIVEQAHITDLRSLAKLGGERIIIVEPPPPPPPEEPDPPAPPIAQAQFFDAKNFSGSTMQMGPSTTDWTNFPPTAYWDVGVPSWATTAEILFQVTGMQLREGGAIGDMRVDFDNGDEYTVPTKFDLWHDTDLPIGGWQRHPMFAAGTINIHSSDRGKIKRFRVQTRLTDNDQGELHWVDNTAMVMQIVFKQNPIVD